MFNGHAAKFPGFECPVELPQVSYLHTDEGCPNPEIRIAANPTFFESKVSLTRLIVRVNSVGVIKVFV